MRAPTLEEKVAFLRRPGSYPEGTERVETIETHMARVFLTDCRAYKLKKPVRYEFLDFSTPEARREDCLAEVRLNRRLAPDVYLERLRGYVLDNRRELTRPEFGLGETAADAIGGRLEGFLAERAGILEARVRDGRIVEGHGDLRPEHVCLRPDPVFIDCIEFRREFRLVDPADELAFLGIECEGLGARWIGDVFLETYRAETGDPAPPKIVEFYRCHRAYLRAKLSVWHVRDGAVTAHEPWRARARDYLELAADHLPG